ncbi:MAG TPA: zinc-binding dehydrogenase [Solirubrobacteraceae bacterium]|nr:zinc-binding dehydrogenase [Solirubrobacteraceae bacterium]
MKAVVIRHYGGPEVLELLDWPEPDVGPHDVLIRVHAVTVGRVLDVEVRRRGADLGATLPRILGSDPAGIVVAIGSEVSAVSPGDRVVCTSTLFCSRCDYCRAGLTNACVEHRVVGVHIDGGYAEYSAVPEAVVVRVPNHVALDQAAAMGVSYPVAWNLLKYAGAVRAGDDVLIMAAGGGLGIAGVLVARALGARVIAAAGSDWKLERCRALLGVEDTVNYADSGWAERVRELSAGGDGVHVVFENIGSPDLFGEALASLRRYGRLVTCGSHGGAVVPLSMRSLYRRHLTIAGDTGATSSQTREVFQLLTDRRLEPPPVSHHFPLADAAAAHEAASGRDLFGRAVLVVREEEAVSAHA